MKLVMEKWDKFLNEIKFSFKKKSRSMEDEMGSKDQPCDPDDAKPRRDLGKKQFDPYNTSRDAEEWECNTKLEDDLLHALQTYIAGNSTEPVQGRVGEFILDHFKDKTDPNLPLSRQTKPVDLYRGIRLYINETSLNFLSNIDWDSGKVKKVKGQSWGVYTNPAPYTMLRSVASFSYDWNAAHSFTEQNKSPVKLIFYTTGDQQTEGGGFFIDFTNFYSLRKNPYQKMPDDKEFHNVQNFFEEQEALLVGAGRGDKIPLQAIQINLSKLRMGIENLDVNDPMREKFSVIYAKTFGKRELRKKKRQIERDMKGLDAYIKTKFKQDIANKNFKNLKYVMSQAENEIENIRKNRRSITALVGQDLAVAYEKSLIKNLKILRRMEGADKETAQEFVKFLSESKSKKIRVLKK